MSDQKATQKRTGKGKNKKQPASDLTEVIHPHAAGIDIGATAIYVAVPPDRDAKPVQRFSSFTDDLHRIGDWLLKCKVTTVAMESTGVYWIALYEILESKGLEVHLVNARAVKNVPGRKTDVQDAQWLLTLHRCGLMRGSFRPKDDICALRAVCRHREQLVQTMCCYTQHIQKALTQMNLQIHHVLSDITGVSGLAILDAIVAGERDPKVLASLSHPRVRTDRATIERSLTGHWRREHLFTLEQSLESYRYFLRQIQACDQQIHQMAEAMEEQTQKPLPAEERTGKRGNKSAKSLFLELGFESQMYRICGVNLLSIPGISAHTCLTFLSEVGTDLSRFKSVHHFCSWLRLCPQNKISGDRILSCRTPRHKNKFGLALRIAAQSLNHSKSALGDKFRRLKAKLGAPKAITAMAHCLARIIFAMMIKKQGFNQATCIQNESKRLQQRQNWLTKQLHLVTQAMAENQQVKTFVS